MSCRRPLVRPRQSARTLLVILSATMLAACSFASPESEAPTQLAAPTPAPTQPQRPLLSDITDIEPSGPASKRPNIVLIMTDDMRADELRWMPRTRRLLGAAGVRFANAFAPHPVCCPARASTVTGQYTHNHGVYAVRKPWGFHSLDDSKTLAVWLKRADYHPLFLGKYLNGYGTQRPPDDSAPNSTRYVPPGWSDWRAAIGGGLPPGHPMTGGTYRYYDMTLNVNGRLVPSGGQYSTTLLGDHTVDMIHDWAPKPKPFFLWANYVAPHYGGPKEPDDPKPFVAAGGRKIRVVTPAVTDRVRDKFDDIIRPRTLKRRAEKNVADKPVYIRNRAPLSAKHWAAITESARQRAESLRLVDAQVARTVRALRASGELGNTIIAFTSDNGYFLGEHRMGQGKILPYEPSLRVPVLVRGPGIPRGDVRRDPFLLIDFAPTFLAVAGAEASIPIDGQSMLQIAREGDRGWRRGVLTETGPRRVTITVDGERRSVVLPRGTADPRFSVGIRTARYLYVEHANDERELYDLRRDPGQLTNRFGAPAYREVQAHLARTLRGLRDCVGAECRVDLAAPPTSR
jgi:arylsulfatase A-like enzyme